MSDDESYFVRKRVADAISEFGYIDLTRSKNIAEKLLEDDHEIVVLAAIEAVNCFPKEQVESILQILRRLMQSPSVEIRKAAESAILTFGSA